MAKTTTNQQDRALTAIARDVLGIPTLEPRRSDSLDFHQIGVWALHKALKVAWARGYEQTIREREAIDNASIAALGVCKALDKYAHNLYEQIPDDLAAIVADAREVQAMTRT